MTLTATQARPRSLTCAETARLVRAALKRAFPGVKFSVRSHEYAGGASLTVTWQDGPEKADVDRLCAPFRGADFDGMIDLQIHRTHWLLPDGSAKIAHSPGTRASGGYLDPINNPAPEGAELVYLGADYIETRRRTAADPF